LRHGSLIFEKAYGKNFSDMEIFCHMPGNDYDKIFSFHNKEVIAKPSGFAGNTGFRPHYSRKGGRGSRVTRGFAITSKGVILCQVTQNGIP
jgi:hypothetical protein